MGFMDFLKREPATIDAVREHLSDSSTAFDLLGLLREHHGYLQESIQKLVDPESLSGEKQTHLARFIRLLNMHGRAEEETLYLRLRHSDVKNARMQGLVGHDEHDIAFQLADELDTSGYQRNWTEEIDAKAKVLAVMVQNHIKEEEEEIFPVASDVIKPEDLQADVPAYLLKCRSYIESELSAPRISVEDPPSLAV